MIDAELIKQVGVKFFGWRVVRNSDWAEVVDGNGHDVLYELELKYSDDEILRHVAASGILELDGNTLAR